MQLLGMYIVVIVSLHPESQSTKNNSANRWGNYDEMMMKSMMKINFDYDDIGVKIASKCLACTIGCWDPELA